MHRGNPASGSGSGSKGGSTAGAVLPCYYRATTVNCRPTTESCTLGETPSARATEVPSGTTVGTSGTTACMPLKNHRKQRIQIKPELPEERPPSGTRCGRPQRYYRISGTTVVPSGTTAWVTGKLPRQADKTINPELPQLLQMSSELSKPKLVE